jgi:hypothetical protein
MLMHLQIFGHESPQAMPRLALIFALARVSRIRRPPEQPGCGLERKAAELDHEKTCIDFALAASPAFAQQPAADPANLMRAVSVLQQQRNSAMDQSASEAVRANGLAEELAKAQARIKELEKSAALKPETEAKPDELAK